MEGVLDELDQRGSGDPLLAAEPHERQAVPCLGAFPLDGELVGLGSTELQHLGGLLDGNALWVVLATTGMRRGEALGLRWSDLALDAGRARVVQTIVQTRSVVSVGEPKTARGRRSLALDAGTILVLREHRRRMLEERLLVGPDFVDHGLVFHEPDGTCHRPDAISARFLRRVAEYGLPRLTLHGLRHTWATLALERGIHPRVVQERLGHSTIAITLGIYSHVSPTLHDEAAQLIADLVL